MGIVGKHQGHRFGVARVPGGGGAPKSNGVFIGGQEQHGLGRQIAARGAGGGAKFVRRIENNGGGAGDARGFGAWQATLRAHVPLVDVFADSLAGDGFARGVQDARPFQLAKNRVDAPGAVDVLQVVTCGGGNFAKAGDAPGNGVDAGDVILDARFARDGQRVENGIGGPAHGDIQAQSVVKSLQGGDVARLEIQLDQFDNLPGGPAVEAFALF